MDGSVGTQAAEDRRRATRQIWRQQWRATTDDLSPRSQTYLYQTSTSVISRPIEMRIYVVPWDTAKLETTDAAPSDVKQNKEKILETNHQQNVIKCCMSQGQAIPKTARKFVLNFLSNNVNRWNVKR